MLILSALVQLLEHLLLLCRSLPILELDSCCWLAFLCIVHVWCRSSAPATFVMANVPTALGVQESLTQSVSALQRVLGLGFFMEEASRRLATVMERQRQRAAAGITA